MDLLAADMDLAPSEVYPKTAYFENRLTGSLIGGSQVAQSDSNTGHQFTDTEGFGEIVIGARIESGDFVLLLAASGDHNDRDCRPVPDSPGDLYAVNIGQAKVENDQVRLVIGRVSKTGFASNRFDNPKVLFRKGDS